MAKHPESHALSLIHWDFFAHLTLPTRLLGAGAARLGGVIFAWLRGVAAAQGVHFKKLVWCTRSELGELNGRLHFHCLIAGCSSTSRRYRFQAKNSWEDLTGAMARVFKFDNGLPGVEYLLKEGVSYEMGKFASVADVVTLSNSCEGLLALIVKRTSDNSMRHRALIARPVSDSSRPMLAI